MSDLFNFIIITNLYDFQILEKSNTTMRWGNELVMSAHEGPKSQLPSHEAPRASPREHWGMYSKESSSPLQLSLLERLEQWSYCSEIQQIFIICLILHWIFEYLNA